MCPGGIEGRGRLTIPFVPGHAIALATFSHCPATRCFRSGCRGLVFGVLGRWWVG